MSSSYSTKKLRRDARVFLSAVSREVGSLRDFVQKALLDVSIHPVDQILPQGTENHP